MNQPSILPIKILGGKKKNLKEIKLFFFLNKTNYKQKLKYFKLIFSQ